MKTLKIFDTDAFVDTNEATILTCEKSNKEGYEDCYEVITDSTIFAPEGGGQKCDEGFFEDAPVKDVQEISGEIIHFLENEIKAGTKVLQKIDMNLRFRRMQNHNAEHLICGLIHAKFGYDNVGFHLSEIRYDDGSIASIEAIMDVDGPVSAEDLKETFGKFKSQIGVIVIMAILAFSAAMGFGIYENMGKDVDSLLRISGLDLPDADFAGDLSMGETVGSFEMVDNIHYEYWTSLEFIKGKKVKTISSRVISDPSLMNPDQMVEGRWPLYENEVALGTSAMTQLGVKVGDTVIVRNGEEEASYLITGMMQTFNNMGMMGYISTDGFERIGVLPNQVTFVIYLKDGYTYEDLKKEFNDIYPDTEIIDELASTGNLFVMLKTSMALIMVLIMIITAFIVALAEALLIRTRITKEWRNLGVNKALGFTSNQLITQVMISNIPAILIGIVLGLILVTFFGDKMMLLMFAIFGFKKVSFSLSPFAYISVIIVIVGVAMLVSWINGKRIRRLEPVKMITEE